jgi:hypothetical protein
VYLKCEEVETSCCSESNVNKEKNEEEKSPLKSEIVEKGLPYKEIEAIINDNSMIVRMQTEAPQLEFDPSCDCLAPIDEQCSSKKNEVGVTFYMCNFK